MESRQAEINPDCLAAQIVNGEISATASLVDVLTAWGVAMPNKRKSVAGAIMAFVDGASVQDGRGKNGEDFRANNPQLSAVLEETFNQEMPLFGYKRYARKDEERARALIFSPLAAFYNLPTKVDPAMPDDAALAADTLERIEAKVDYLYEDRKRTKANNRERGKAIQAKADNAERQRAERDVEEALQMVHDRISHGEKNVISICRRYCDWTDKAGKLHKGHFRRLTNKKLPSGEYADYSPLIGANGKPIKPETLARYYRNRYGAAKKRKANAAANKARTQAARNAKAAKHPRPTRCT